MYCLFGTGCQGISMSDVSQLKNRNRTQDSKKTIAKIIKFQVETWVIAVFLHPTDAQTIYGAT
jgi:hypothetical protein